MELHKQVCEWCHGEFVLCRACFRGHRYCSGPCRQQGRQTQVCLARQRYGRTDKGRQNNRERQCRLRVRRCLEDARLEGRERPKVTDQTSPLQDPQPNMDSAREWTVATRPQRTRAGANPTCWSECGPGPALASEDRCQRCGREGVVVRVPPGWVRRGHQFVAPTRRRWDGRIGRQGKGGGGADGAS
jgi:hypothetical protein